jgi:hypothetical protein
VTGVEVRESLVHQAQETFAFYGQDPETYRFVCGDVFEVLAREKFDVDVVLCLGYLYHTYRHSELMYRLHGLAPKHLVVDTMVVPGSRRILRVFPERNSEAIRSAAQDAYSVGRVLVAWPSVPALQLLLAAYGFEIESRYDWKGRLAGRPPTLGLTGLREGQARDPAMPLPGSGHGTGMGAGRLLCAPHGPTPGQRTQTDHHTAPRAAGPWMARAGQQDADQSHRLRAAASVHHALRARPEPEPSEPPALSSTEPLVPAWWNFRFTAGRGCER